MLFNKYETNIEVRDPGLRKYINLQPILLPKSSGRHGNKRFGKSKMHIVERLINKIGVSGHKGKRHRRTSGRNTGKMQMATNIVLESMSIIQRKTGKNPIEVIVRAVENSAPMQETTVIEYGGIKHPRCVDVSPQRRIDLSLRWITQGSYQKASSSKKGIANTLAEELISASESDAKAFCVGKKTEVERQSVASR